MRNSRKTLGRFDVFQLFLTMVDFKALEKLLTVQEIVSFEKFLAMLDFNLHQSSIVRNSRKKPGRFDVFQLFLTKVDFRDGEKLLTMQKIMGF